MFHEQTYIVGKRSPMAQQLRIGVVTDNDPRKGLWRDAECLLWLLGAQVPDEDQFAGTLFPIQDRGAIERSPLGARAAPCCVPSYPSAPVATRFADWLDGLHAVLFCEYLMPRTFALILGRGVRVVYIPNLDWAVVDYGSNDTETWAQTVRSSGVEVWAKTPMSQHALGRLQIPARLVSWSIPDPVRRRRRQRAADGAVRFFMNAGNGGFRNRRGVDIALEAFRQARRQNSRVTLTIKTLRPFAQYFGPGVHDLRGVTAVEGFVARPRITRMYREYDAVLHPSRWEGFGLPLLEALHAGAAVIATDGWPMNELVRHEANGLLVRADQLGMFRLVPRWECRAAELAATMLRFAEEEACWHRLASADGSDLQERQRAFLQIGRQATGMATAPPQQSRGHASSLDLSEGR